MASSDFFAAAFRLLLVSLLLAEVRAVNSTANACRQLSSHLGNVTILPSQSIYQALAEENWSETAWASPICVVQPYDLSEVQRTLRILTNNNVNFAIRSRGHMPSPGAANIENGVLIDMSRFDQVEYDPARSLAIVGTGQKWGNVYGQLDQYNVTVVGGRVLEVGVGGLILGSCADGSVVNANSTANQDLFWALKGGSNSFGIVTAFTLNTNSIHMVWGGIKEYSLEYLPAIMQAMLKYQSNPDKDPYANIMMQAFVTNSSVGVVLNIVYLKPVTKPVAFEPFYSFPTIDDTTKIMTLLEMIGGQRVPPIPRWDWHATSFTPDLDLYMDIANITTTAPELKQIEGLTSGTLALGMQPISSSAVRAGRARGGNALGLQPVNQTWFVLDVGWNDYSDDAVAHDATASLLSKVEAASRQHAKYIEYIFMNDASYSQDVIGHYGSANVARLQSVQRKYDPSRVFNRLVSGGFKVLQSQRPRRSPR